MDYNPVLKKTKLTAPKHIENLKQFVQADLNVTPRLPASDAVNKIEAMPVLQPDDVGYDQQQRDKQWMWEILGHIQHVCKVRMDCKTATNKCARHSHAPCPLAIKCVKQIAHYLIGTSDIGLEFGHPDAKYADLIWHRQPDEQHVFDPTKKIMAYYAAVDGALSANDRSTCGIIHMFAGAAFDSSSARQHSVAEHAYVSEAYSASICCAGSTVYRGIFTECGIDQSIPTPIYTDSRSTILAARSLGSLKKSLYILRRVLFMLEGHDEGEFEFYSCKGEENPADVFTKIVQYAAFLAARNIYMGHLDLPIFQT